MKKIRSVVRLSVAVSRGAVVVACQTFPAPPDNAGSGGSTGIVRP